jgi:hypothetical protein
VEGKHILSVVINMQQDANNKNFNLSGKIPCARD